MVENRLFGREESVQRIIDTVDYISSYHFQLPNYEFETCAGEVEMFDSILLSALTALVDGKALFLGNPGSGKTTSAKYISQTIYSNEMDEIERAVMHGHPQVTEEKLIGAPHLGRLQKDGEIEVIWSQAVTLDGPIIIDEINRMPGQLQSMLLDLVDTGVASYMGETKQRSVKSCFATANYYDEGNTELLPPMADRFDVSLYFKPPVGLVPALLNEESLEDRCRWNSNEVAAVRQQIEGTPWSAEAIGYLDLLFAELAYNTASGEIRKGEILSAENGHHDREYLFGRRDSDVSTRFILGAKKYAQAVAFMRGSEVAPQDIKFVAPYLLAHRIKWSKDALRDASDELLTRRDKKPIDWVASYLAVQDFDERFNDYLRDAYSEYVELLNNCGRREGAEKELEKFLEKNDHPLFKRINSIMPYNLRRI